MRLSLKGLSPYSISLKNDRFANIIENIDSINVSDNEIELEATLIQEIDIESRNEPLEIVVFIKMTVSAEDLEYNSYDDYVHASRLRASSDYEIHEDEKGQYSEQELREIKTYVEEYLVGPNSVSTYEIEDSFDD